MSVTLEKGKTINFYQAATPIIISVFGVYLTIGIAIGAPLSIWLGKSFGDLPAFLLIIALPFVSWLATAKLPSMVFGACYVLTPRGIPLVFEIIEQFIVLYFDRIRPNLAF